MMIIMRKKQKQGQLADFITIWAIGVICSFNMLGVEIGNSVNEVYYNKSKVKQILFIIIT